MSIGNHSVTFCVHCLESWTYDVFDTIVEHQEWSAYLNDVLLEHLLENLSCLEATKAVLKAQMAIPTIPVPAQRTPAPTSIPVQEA